MHRSQAPLCPSFPTRLHLLVGFSALVAVFVAAIALGVGHLLRESIREAALSGAEQTGRVFSELEMGEEEYRGRRLTDAARGDLDTAVAASSTLRAAKVWAPDLSVVYSSSTRTRPPRQADAVRGALRGEIESRTSGPLLRIYVPITLAGDRRPRSVLELHLPYAPVQAKIDRRTKSLAFVLGLGALLFYAALLPSVLRGSRALAGLYEARENPLQRRLRRAIRDGELALAYQPKLDLRSGKVEGVEALLRWRLPDGRIVAPVDYIPRIEPTPVMGDLTAHVFQLAADQAAAWDREGLALDIAVNISASNLSDAGLPERLVGLTHARGLSSERVTLELTEGAMSQSREGAHQTLADLRARGFKLSIDDFGTGESSLSRMHAAEFQEVKIDRCFVQRLEEHGDPALITGIIDLARALGATVVAEGVESEQTARRLGDLGCDVLQGFHLGRPMPAGELERWLEAFEPAVATG